MLRRYVDTILVALFHREQPASVSRFVTTSMPYFKVHGAALSLRSILEIFLPNLVYKWLC